nr:MAG TPA: hypothetical protein [Caudoviricetes sp.]DAW36048.1 MAG TPA: hypothetical protein [Caudoviricetes sp.]
MSNIVDTYRLTCYTFLVRFIKPLIFTATV